MENRIVVEQDLIGKQQPPPPDPIGNETSLTAEELHALVEFFQLLDGWDREVVQ